jgi:hypothetical protein
VLTPHNFKKNKDNRANLVLLVGGLSIGALIVAVLLKYDGYKENDDHKIKTGDNIIDVVFDIFKRL